MRTRTIISLGALLITAALLASGCGRSSLRAQEAITVGMLAPLTSGVPGAARAAVQGATLAVEEINGAGGLGGASVTLAVEDDRGSVDEVARKFDRLMQRKVLAIIGPLTDATATAVAPLAERTGMAVISPGATGTIPYAGSAVFRTSLGAQAQARILAEFLVQVRKARRIAAIHERNDYGTLITMAFTQRLRELGAEVVGSRLYKDGDTHFERHATGVVGDGAQAVFIAGYPDEGALILTALRERGVGVPIAGADALFSPDLLEWAPQAAEGLYLPAPFVATEPLPAVQEFVGRYRKRYNNETPDHFAAQAYDATKILASAIRRGGRTAAAVRSALQGLRRYPGVTGEITFDRFGTPDRPVSIVQVQKGQFVVVQR